MNREAFYAEIRKDKDVFGSSIGSSQFKGIQGILAAFETHGDGRDGTLAYALATAYHETGGGMLPVKETVFAGHKDKNPSDETVAKRLDAWAARTGRTNRYWDRTPPYGHRYFGRGLVQLTHAENYKASSDDAGVDLVRKPDYALDPEIAARILIRGLLDGRWNGKGKGIVYYLDRGDLKNARRTVNITDKWDVVAKYHKAFLRAIQAAGGVSAALPIDLPDLPASEAHVKPNGILAVILRLLGVGK